MGGYTSDQVVQRLEEAISENREVLRDNPGLAGTVKLAKAHIRLTNPDPDGSKVQGHQQEREYQKVLTQEKARAKAREDIAAEKAAENRGPFTVHTRDTLHLLPEVSWHVKGFLPTDGLVFVFGDSNVGKTVVLMDMVASCAAGTKFVNHFETRPTRFLYVTGEGVSGFRSRVAEAEAQHNVELTADTFHLVTDGVTLMDPNSVAEVAEYVREHDIDVVILDTYAQLAGISDENDAALNSQALRAADRIRKARQGTSVLLVHHSGKDADRGMRGSSALRGNSDYVWQLDTDSATQIDGGVGLTLSSYPSNGGKARHSAPETVRGFARVEGHIEVAETAPVWLQFLPLCTPISTPEIHDAIAMSEAQNKRLMKKAVDDGYLRKVSHGVYERPVWA